MVKRILSLLLIVALLTGTAAAAVPYAIKVNRAANTVTIYGLDENGQHTVPVKAMICSTARPGHTTPAGTFQLAEYRSEWRLMLDGTYGQYATCFSGNYLFHSICYADDAHDAMIRTAYNNLGSAASMGCVRLETIDAKWIFDNCPAGTPVTVYDDAENPGPLGKPERTVPEITEAMYNGWDPTDPAPGNPWRLKPLLAVTMEEAITIRAGEAAALTAVPEPENAMLFWRSDNEKVATVDSHGRVTAHSAGTATIRAEGYNGNGADCTVTVEGELLPFDDLIPGAWYYPAVRQACERGLFKGAEGQFNPNGTMTRAMVVQVLYNRAGSPKVTKNKEFSDVPSGAWYENAILWAVSQGIMEGVTSTQFAPDRPMTRQELATVLWRLHKEPKVSISLTDFTDLSEIRGYALPAMAWIVKSGHMQGADSKLRPAATVTRAETASILCSVFP